MKISKLKQKCYEEYERNGFADYWNKGNLILSDLAEIGLITTEIAEALESVRNGDKENLQLELADIIIRTLNYCTRKKIDIELALMQKIVKNNNREYKHGKRNI